MQFKLTLPVVKAVGTGFRPSISATLTGITVVGAFSATLFNSKTTLSSIGNSLDPLKEALLSSYLTDGVIKVGETLKNWGSSIVNSKDAFIDWLDRYLDANGLKSGTSELYEKLKGWSEIVYNWFATKFIEFIKNIPRMVKEWDKLRLSLFKWGTFLGGGGGQAFWAMFGNSDNWSKLGELMGHPDFAEMMQDFDKLVQDNEESFKEMGSEGIEEIMQKYLDNPEEAKQAAKDLLEEQKEKKKENENKKEEEEEEKQSEELSSEEIRDKFNPQKGGKPKDPAAVLGSMTESGLKGLLSLPSFDSSFDTIKKKAQEGMMRYIEDIKNDVKTEKSKKPSPKKQFLNAINGSEEAFTKSLSEFALKAYQLEDSRDIKKLINKFADVLENAVTIPCGDGEQCDASELAKSIRKD